MTIEIGQPVRGARPQPIESMRGLCPRCSRRLRQAKHSAALAETLRGSALATIVANLSAVKKWAKAQEKQFKQLKKLLEKAEDVATVLKGLDVSEPGLRSFRNRARKLQREFPTPARSRNKVLREVDGEIKRFGKILALV